MKDALRLVLGLQRVLNSGMTSRFGIAILCSCLLLAFAAQARSQAEWTWMGGSSIWGAGPSYGMLGKPYVTNMFGSRQDAATWIDKSGNLWMFGGYGFDSTSGPGPENDLWEFNPTTLEWTWMGGSEINQRPGVYGTMGTPAAVNIPGARMWASSWTDSNGNLWLFGGLGYDSTGMVGSLNDLWEFNPTTLEWAWMGGSNTVSVMGDGNDGTSGVYGTLGVPAPGNQPGARYGANVWTDGNGNLWLYGGYGYDDSLNGGYLNDLWEYNFSTSLWTWEGGASTMSCTWECSGPGVYGSSGVPASGNVPAGREDAVSWTDSRGNFWLFGGYSADNIDDKNVMNNELWVLNPSTNEWTWMGGAGAGGSNYNQAGVYGTLGTPASGNMPGARMMASGWSDSSGNLWLFAGWGYDSFGNREDLNDLWVFNPVTLEWAWMDGDKSTTNCRTNDCGEPGIYGTVGIPAAGNLIGGRYGASVWGLGNGNLWVFGGWGADVNGAIGQLSDTWLYQSSVPATAAPTFSLPAGNYTSAQTVTLSDTNANAAIYYTTDGTVPTTSSTLYYRPGMITKPIPVTSTETIQAIAIGPGENGSSVASATYTLNLPAATPAFSLPGGTYNSVQSVTLSDATTGATIYYTTNGTTPTTSSPVYSGSIPVSTTEMIQAVAVAPGYSNSAIASATYTINLPSAATPAFSLPVGNYTSTEQTGISDATPGATIYYTTDGSAPTTSSTKYTGAIAISASETIKAIAVATGYSSSAVASATYTLAMTASTPVISPSGGTYTTVQTVTLADYTTGAAIYFTTDGSTPTASSTLYSGPITVSSTESVKAIAAATGYSNSAVASAIYTINLSAAATPTFSVQAGTYTAAQTVTLSDTTPSATIYYTTNGTTPTAGSTPYTGAITVSATETLQAIAVAPGYNNSTVASAVYTINPGAFSCHIIYTITPQNTTAFGATITIENTGTAAIGSWTLTWTFANGQEITQLWNGNETQTGAKVTVTNPSYNTGIPAGSSNTGMGFNGTWNGATNTAPTSFAVNGTTCK